MLLGTSSEGLTVLALFESPESWLLVGLIAILPFGSSKLPGRSKSEFER
jgi:mttA/Hcf106 family